MKQSLVLAGCAVFLSVLVGCQNNEVVEVIIDGDGRFPQSLVGTWKADPEQAGWEFVFRPDGTISSAIIDNGMLRVDPAQRVATIPLKDGGKGTYKLGKWTVQYSPDERELSVMIVVDYLHLDMLTYGIKGRTADWFVGPVSQDGQSWFADWFTFPKYTLLMPEPSELPIDPNDNPKARLVFTKQEGINVPQ